jgi:hypothetical protein
MKGWMTIVLLFCIGECLAQHTNNFLPDYIKVQHAGSIGFMSIGTGYDLFRNRVEAEVLYGYVPARFGGPLNIATFRLVLNPLRIRVNETVSVNLLKFSGFITYHFGEKFYAKLPSYYPEGYYGWSSAIRYHAGFGSDIAYRSPKSGHGFSLYYEFNTNDLYLKSLKANSELNMGDILSLGVGVKLY